MTNGDYYFDEETFTKGLTREETLESQIRLIAFSYTRGHRRDFQLGIKILITLLPKNVREDFKPLDYDASDEGMDKHYQQFLEIQEKLESDTNMIWKKKFIKTYS